MQKKTMRIIAIVLAAIMACSVFIGALASVSRAVSQSEIDSLKNKKSEIEQQGNEIESQIDSLEYEQAGVLEKKEMLDEKIIVTQELIDNLAEQIEIYNGLIADKQKEVDAAQKREDDQYELYKDRLRAMEENGTISYFEIIFGATSFTDLLSRIELISEIMNYDEEVYDSYVAAKEETVAAKEELESVNAQQEAAKAEQEAKAADLQAQVAEAEAMIAEIENDIIKYKDEYEELQAEEAKIQEEIDSKIAQMKREEEEAKRKNASGGGGGGSVTGKGNFIWPSASSRYITSLFGTRLHPVYHTYKTHNGVDIGAGYGTSVLAADSGTVTTSTYSSSYGYYIVINHGNGTTTLYAHMSKLLVSVGDTVSQGEVIGLVGSTGVSTGAHLHFEITYKGSRVNPLNYFSNYTISPNA